MSLDTAGGSTVGSSGALDDTFYPVFNYLFDANGEFVKGVEEKLAEARMADNVEMFISRAIGVGIAAGLALWLIGTLVGYLAVSTLLAGQEITFLGLTGIPPAVQSFINAIEVPAIILITGVIFGTIGFGIGFGSLVSIPYFRSNAREREINVLLSDSISFMYALSVGGLNQLEILEAMATADDTYGECAKEFQSIVLETQYFDTDYRTAVRNQAIETPSDELSQFLTDMLSIINSGGDMTSFLEDQKDKHIRTAKNEQKKMLDTLELFGEMYMTLSLFPLLLVIILVIMSMMGNGRPFLLWGTVYLLIPLIGMAFMVLLSTVTQDTIGDGYLQADEEEVFVDEGLSILNLGLIDQFTGEWSVFDRIRSREGTHEFLQILKRPDLFFRDHPTLVLTLTIPMSIVAIVFAIVLGWAPLALQPMIDHPVRGTFFWIYVPLYLNAVPLAIFYEWNVRSRKAVIGNLSENLRKLASANDTGMTLLESIRVVADTSAGKLADEFEIMYSKVNYGTSLKDALREFNNKYHVPRLARTVKLISEAQEASSQIQSVLSTAAQASENQDDIARERISRTRMQVVIILMTYLTLLGVMALLKTEFLDVMTELAGTGAGIGGSSASSSSATSAANTDKFGGNVDPDQLSMMFFHAVTLQGLLSSFIAGYIRDVNLLSGLKFAIILNSIALLTWMAIA